VTTVSEKQEPAAHLVYRPEGSGFLVYAPNTGAYLFSTSRGRDLLEVLAESLGHDDCVATVARRFDLDQTAAGSWVALVTDLLACRRPDQAQSGSLDRDKVGVWLLEEVMGDVGQRCETFGMPF
jgi:hypothetical protein